MQGEEEEAEQSEEDEQGAQEGTPFKPKKYGPDEATAAEEDPSYRMKADPAPWAQVLTSAGHLKDYQSETEGWWVHFRNPTMPLRPVEGSDLVRVFKFLGEEVGLAAGDPKKTPGIFQIPFGSGTKQGNIQLFTTKFGRTSGNACINIGNVERLRETRQALLHSAWFMDAIPGRPAASTTAFFQSGGKTVLPSISAKTSADDIEKLLQGIAKRLGTPGKKAMQKYLQQVNLPESCDAKQMLDKAFGGQSPASAKTKKPPSSG